MTPFLPNRLLPGGPNFGKWFIPLIILGYTALFLLLSMNLILQGCGREEMLSKKDSAIPVTLSTVTAMDVHLTIEQVGTLDANETLMVKSEAQGKINPWLKIPPW